MNLLSKIANLLQYVMITTLVNAQEISGIDAQENLFKLGGIDATSGVVRKFDNRYEGVQGSPFYFDNWSNGSVIFVNEQRMDNVPLKYNAYEDELIINKTNVGQFYLTKESVSSFALTDETSGETHKFIKYDQPRKDQNMQYYKVIITGSINVVEYLKVVFEKADFEGGYSSDKRYDEFKKYPIFYYYSNSSPKPQKLKSSPNAISKIFLDRNEQIKKFILDNSMDCTSEKDLIRIFEYYMEIK